MTGFSRQEGGNETLAWAWEIKSVNGKGLDVRCRLPNGFEALDQTVRSELGKHCSRGNFQVGLTVKRAAQPAKLRLNREVLDQIASLAGELGDELAAAPPRLDGLLSFPGVIEADAEEWRRGLAALGEDDGARSWPGFPLDAAGYLAMVAGHDREHLEQMR